MPAKKFVVLFPKYPLLSNVAPIRLSEKNPKTAERKMGMGFNPINQPKTLNTVMVKIPASVPSRLIPPDVPFGTSLKFVIR
jgi:hypothetical protein